MGKDSFHIDYRSAKKAVLERGKQTSSVGYFGKEKDDYFKSSLAAIYQTFDPQELYPSIEEKAANLLYFIVKNHSFVDGNNRIAAFLFLWFLEGNRILYKSDGSRRIQDNALVALTLMIAESKPQERARVLLQCGEGSQKTYREKSSCFHSVLYTFLSSVFANV